MGRMPTTTQQSASVATPHARRYHQPAQRLITVGDSQTSPTPAPHKETSMPSAATHTPTTTPEVGDR